MYKTLGFKWLIQVYCPASALVSADRYEARNPQRFIHATVTTYIEKKFTDMKNIIFLFLLILAVTGKPQNSFAQSSKDADTVLALVISNEAPGYLIDNMIANGFGDSCLYSVLVAMQPESGGVITDAFLDSLYASQGDDIFNYPLSVFSDSANNPIVIGLDGTAHVAPVYGHDFYQVQGFNTYNDTLVPVGLKLFTYATAPAYYIDAGTGSGFGHYKVFAIAWSLGSTFVLSNEAPGYLIDKLIANGYGNNNLFEVMTALQPVSGGTIPLEFMNQLATCPPGSDIFTAALYNFAGLNNPVCINLDGMLRINPIFGNDYFQQPGYETYIGNQAGVGNELFTYAKSPHYYVDAGWSVIGGDTTNFRAFALAWSDPTADIPEAESSHSSFFVYPNPFSEGFYIQDLANRTQLQIFDLLGKRLYQTEPKTNIMIQPVLLPDGMYILKLINSRGSWQQKIVKY